MKMRILGTLALTGSLFLSAAAMSGAKTKPMPAAKKAANSMILCPIMKTKTPKSKAIKVTAANGKSTYVCCKACIEPAKKQLMAKK
jgi:predicted phage tail protein